MRPILKPEKRFQTVLTSPIITFSALNSKATLLLPDLVGLSNKMNGTPLILAIIGHLVGDYLLQNDWMATNKKKHSFPCAVHCLLWTCSVMFFAGWMWIEKPHFLWIKPWVFSALFLTHFIQDRTQIIIWWMKLKWKDQSKFMECDSLLLKHEYEPTIKVGLGPWSIIVVDNVWHIVEIWAVWRFLT